MLPFASPMAKEFNYKSLYRIIHEDFLKALKKHKITREEFLKRTGYCSTNGSCYYKGTKILTPQTISDICILFEIPFSEVSPHYASRFLKIHKSLKSKEITDFPSSKPRSQSNNSRSSSNNSRSLPNKSNSL